MLTELTGTVKIGNFDFDPEMKAAQPAQQMQSGWRVIGTPGALSTGFGGEKRNVKSNFLLIDNEDYCDILSEPNSIILPQNFAESTVDASMNQEALVYKQANMQMEQNG